jgi:hypothetical protein
MSLNNFEINNKNYLNEYKEYSLIREILLERNEAAGLIQKNYKIFKNRQKIKNLFLISNILTQRRNMQKILYYHIKNYLFKLKVKKLIKHANDYFYIIPKIQIKNMMIKFFFDSKNSKIYPLKYCELRKIYYFELKRNLFRKLLYKFYFIINGNRMLDTNITLIKTKDGFMNLLNIKKYQEKEFELECYYKKQIEDFKNYAILYSDTTSSGSNESDNKDFLFEICNPQNNIYNQKKNYITNTNNNLKGILKKNNYYMKNFENKYDKNDINKDKNILNQKKKNVSFGKIEIKKYLKIKHKNN